MARRPINCRSLPSRGLTSVDEAGGHVDERADLYMPISISRDLVATTIALWQPHASGS
jgi:hypothetical protein